MPGSTPANQPARLAHLDDGNDRAILVQGHEGPAQIVRLGHRGTPSIDVSDEIAILAARPIASLRWREPNSNHRSRSCERLFWALPIGDGGPKKAEPLTGSGPKRQCLPGVAAHSLSLRRGTVSSNPSSSSGESDELPHCAAPLLPLPGCGANRATGPMPTAFWPRFTAGSLRVSAPLIPHRLG